MSGACIDKQGKGFGMVQHKQVGFHFKVTLLCCLIASASVILPPLSANSAIQGDINNDGKIDTSEAIYALQVAAGLFPGVSTSCLLSGKGDWTPDTEYVECDVVSSDGENYVCNTSHTSPASVFGDDVANWDLLSLKGDKGDPGDDSEKTTSFTDLTDQAADAQIPTAIARDSEITWNNLTNIPAGFADGTDSDSGGDITNVTAGSGLIGGGSSGGVTLSHSNTSSQVSMDNYNGIVIQDIALDTYGHLTGMSSANLDSRYYTETEANSNYVNVSGDSMTGALSIVGTLKVSPAGGSTVTSNTMRNDNTHVPTSGDITSSGDLYLSHDLEVGGEIYASKKLYMNGNNSTGDDGDQAIFFYNGGSQEEESIKWNEVEGRFELSTHAKINGHLRVTEDVIVTQNVNVTGAVSIGWERITGDSVLINNSDAGCTHFQGTCYSGEADVSCPLGYAILGGGCSTNPSNKSILTDSAPTFIGFPIGYWAWYCSAYSSDSSSTVRAYALCARIAP